MDLCGLFISLQNWVGFLLHGYLGSYYNSTILVMIIIAWTSVVLVVILPNWLGNLLH